MKKQEVIIELNDKNLKKISELKPGESLSYEHVFTNQFGEQITIHFKRKGE